MKSARFHVSEAILILSGLFILISAFMLYQNGDFSLWVWAKVFYGIGVLAFLFNL